MGRTTEDCNIQCKNITKRWTRATTGRLFERKQHEMGRDRARRSPKKRGKVHKSPKWPPAVPLWGQQCKNRCRFSHEQEMERQHNKSILWEFQSSSTRPTHNRQIPTEDRSSICANDISLRQTTSTTPLIRSWKSTHITQLWWGTLMRKLEDKQIHQKGRQDASVWVSEMKEETLL